MSEKPDYLSDREWSKLIREKQRERVPEVFDMVYHAATSGDLRAAELFLKYTVVPPNTKDEKDAPAERPVLNFVFPDHG